MMFSISLFLQQYLQNIYYGKFFILTICAIVLKIYELAILVYKRTRQKEKSKECAQQYFQIYQMSWSTQNISSKYVFGRTTYYCGKYQFYMYHANRWILYKKDYDPFAEILFDYSYIKSVAVDIDESPTLLQISEE